MMVEIVRIVDEVPGQCPVMFCISAPHEGSTHADVTGKSFEACEHGTLEHWGECRECTAAEQKTPLPSGSVIISELKNILTYGEPATITTDQAQMVHTIWSRVTEWISAHKAPLEAIIADLQREESER